MSSGNQKSTEERDLRYSSGDSNDCDSGESSEGGGSEGESSAVALAQIEQETVVAKYRRVFFCSLTALKKVEAGKSSPSE